MFFLCKHGRVWLLHTSCILKTRRSSWKKFTPIFLHVFPIPLPVSHLCQHKSEFCVIWARHTWAVNRMRRHVNISIQNPVSSISKKQYCGKTLHSNELIKSEKSPSPTANLHFWVNCPFKASPSRMMSLAVLRCGSTSGACSSLRRGRERRGRPSEFGCTISGSWRFRRCFCSSSALCRHNNSINTQIIHYSSLTRCIQCINRGSSIKRGCCLLMWLFREYAIRSWDTLLYRNHHSAVVFLFQCCYC